MFRTCGKLTDRKRFSRGHGLCAAFRSRFSRRHAPFISTFRTFIFDAIFHGLLLSGSFAVNCRHSVHDNAADDKKNACRPRVVPITVAPAKARAPNRQIKRDTCFRQNDEISRSWPYASSSDLTFKDFINWVNGQNHRSFCTHPATHHSHDSEVARIRIFRAFPHIQESISGVVSVRRLEPLATSFQFSGHSHIRYLFFKKNHLAERQLTENSD
jgi:hypothetical protein